MSVSLHKNRSTTRRPAEAIDTTPVGGSTEVLSRSEDVIEAAEAVIAEAMSSGDDLLLASAGSEKVAKVGGGSRASSLQRHQARAWTSGGQVD